MKRWLAVLLLMLGGVGAESVRPGPCQLLSDTGTQRLRERRDDRDRLDERERRRRGF
ncbi:hypothetical protein [Bordetella sp. H567]|uniref:hypothetical protein n=1 Tax=Bordetella sp. H567 TaxID=1697043 RepID=UPI0013140135|nr:hypothetical protein [Bordetella sp. H567]